MSGQADVKSIDTLVFVKAALASFAHESGQALGEVQLEGRRGVEYLTMERAAYWKSEVRRAGDAVNKAIKDLEHCRAFKKVGDNTPSCIEEKKNLDKARKRLEYAEQKEAAVRRWKPVVEQQFRETCVRLVHFREVIEGHGGPRADAQGPRCLPCHPGPGRRRLWRQRRLGSHDGPPRRRSRPDRRACRASHRPDAAGHARGGTCMKSFDLSGGASKLALALKQLDIKWNAATDTWNDATAKTFHKDHIEPIMPDVKQTLEAIGRLAEVLSRAARDVADEGGR